MRFAPRSIACFLGLALGATAAHCAGTVQVAYVQPDRYADVGRMRYEVERNLNELTSQFEALGRRRLADDQTLRIEVLDVDLAGELRPSRRSAEDIRVVRGTVDWPRIRLRYTLESAGQPVRSGERVLQDMAYLQRLGSAGVHGALPYEYRMLEQWFGAEFGPAASK